MVFSLEKNTVKVDYEKVQRMLEIILLRWSLMSCQIFVYTLCSSGHSRNLFDNDLSDKLPVMSYIYIYIYMYIYIYIFAQDGQAGYCGQAATKSPSTITTIFPVSDVWCLPDCTLEMLLSQWSVP